MKEIELYIWASCGRFDSDGYEVDFDISEDQLKTIIGLYKEYNEEGNNREAQRWN